MNEYQLDFQEAFVEVDSAYLHYALTTIEGRRWKMFKSKGVVRFFAEVEGRFIVQIPINELYLAKWQPVKRTVNK